MPGVIRTRVGYTGGSVPNPTYTRLYDHSEAIEIDFDPAVISYEQLVHVFWQEHDPTSRPWSKQYRAALFYHGEAQQRVALETRERLAAQSNGKIRTEILPASDFYRAEDYHQKYMLRNHQRLMTLLNGIYTNNAAFTDATATARLNGYLGGHITLEKLVTELKNADLSHDAYEKVMAIISEKR